MSAKLQETRSSGQRERERESSHRDASLKISKIRKSDIQWKCRCAPRIAIVFPGTFPKQVVENVEHSKRGYRSLSLPPLQRVGETHGTDDQFSWLVPIIIN